MAKGETYEEFVAKFKKDAPKTTDDCYTPQPVYEVVKEYALKLAGLTEETCTPVRPFYPGGDYRNYDYPADAYVIDNPPFSILSEIRQFYMERGIKYFLFAPALMCISPKIDDTIICAYSDIIYTNGATVKTSFVTNAASREFCLMTAPELKKQLKEIFQHDRKIYGEKTRKLKSYIYPKNTFSVRDIALTSRTYFFIRRRESRSVGKIGSLKQFGGAYLLSDRAAAELDKARAAGELEKCRAAAEEFRGKGAIKLYLSPEQEEIVKQLNEKHK